LKKKRHEQREDIKIMTDLPIFNLIKTLNFDFLLNKWKMIDLKKKTN